MGEVTRRRKRQKI